MVMRGSMTEVPPVGRNGAAIYFDSPSSVEDGVNGWCHITTPPNMPRHTYLVYRGIILGNVHFYFYILVWTKALTLGRGLGQGLDPDPPAKGM